MNSSSSPKGNASWARNAYFRAAINFSKNLVDCIEEEVKCADAELLRRGEEYERVSHIFEKQLAQRLRRQTIQSEDVIDARHAYQVEEDTKRRQDLVKIREVYPLSFLEDDAEYHIRTILRSKLLENLKNLEEMPQLGGTSNKLNHFFPLNGQKSENRTVQDIDVSTPPRYVDEISTAASQGSDFPLSATAESEVFFVPRKEVKCHQNRTEVPGSPLSAQTLRDVPSSNLIAASTSHTTESTCCASSHSCISFPSESQPLPSLSALPIAEFEASVLDRSYERREQFLKDRLQLFNGQKKEFEDKRISVRNSSSTSSNGQDDVRSSIEARSGNDDELIPYAERQVEESVKKLRRIQRERKKSAKKAQELIGQLLSIVGNDSKTESNHRNDAEQKSFPPQSSGEEDLIRAVIRQAMKVKLSARDENPCHSAHQIGVPDKPEFSASSLFDDKYFKSFSLPMELSVAQREEVQRYVWPRELENRISHCLCATVEQPITDIKWRPVLLSSVDADALLASAVESGPYRQRKTGRNQKVRVSAVTLLKEKFQSTSAVGLPSALSLAEIASYGASPRRPILPAVGCKVWLHVKRRGESVFSSVHFEGCEI